MVSVVIPAFNEGPTVSVFLEELVPVLDDAVGEIVVVDDGSGDGCCDGLPGGIVRVVTHPVNRGYGAALKTGIRTAAGSNVVLCDADGQHRPEDVLAVVKACGDSDMVVGARDHKSHAPLLRQPGKRVLAAVVDYLAERKIPDFNSGLRSFRRDFILRILHLMPDGFSFSTTSTLAAFKLGHSVRYIPIIVRKRVGTSTVSQVRHGSQTLLLIIRLITLFNPLKVFLPTSGLLFCTGTVLLAYESLVVFRRPHVTPSAMMLFIASLLVFFFGILADQVAALRREAGLLGPDGPRTGA